MKIHIPNQDAITDCARRFLSLIPKETRVIDFDGEMGAGKTTFIAELSRLLGAQDDPASPTFSIVNEYRLDPSAMDSRIRAERPDLLAPDGPRFIYHFDFYRLDSPEQALDIGAEDYFYSGDFCLLEWADNVSPILPAETLHVRLRRNDDNSRTIEF